MSLDDTTVTQTEAPVAPVAEAPVAPAPEAPKQDAAPAKAEAAPSKSEDELLAEAYRAAQAGEEKTATPTDGPVRNEKGQFVSSKLVEDAQPSQEEKAAEAVVDPKAPPKEAVSEGHFRGWSEEKRAAFGKLPKEAQEFAIAHQRDLQSQFSRKEAELQRFVSEVKPLKETIAQYSEYLDMVGHALKRPQHEIISGLMATEKTLRFGSYAEKVKTLLDMAHDYGVPLQHVDEQVAREIGVDPRLHDLNQENARLRAAQDQAKRSLERQQEEETHAKLGAEIERMKSATDKDGSLLYPHFDILGPHMGRLIAAGQAESLEDAYRIASEPMRKAVEAELRKQSQQRQALANATNVSRINVTTAPTQVDRFADEDEALRSAYRRATA